MSGLVAVARVEDIPPGHAARTEIDGRPIANGHPGELARTLRQAYFDYGLNRQDWPVAWPTVAGPK